MLGHYWHPLVLGTYGLLIVANAGSWLPVTWPLVIVESIILLLTDYLVHAINHKWEWLSWPWPSTVWVVAVSTCAVFGLIKYGPQLVVIFIAQALWDNSWHSVFHHRQKRKSKTATDHPFVRWGAIFAAVVAIAMTA